MKYHQKRSNGTKQGVQTVKCLVTKQCLMVCGRQTFLVCPGPGQTINVWRPNTIKCCLVTKHANVEVGGQTFETCLIKHRWNNWFKPLSKRDTHARIKHVWYAAVQTNKTSPIKRANNRKVLSFWSNVWWPSNFIKYDQIRSNTIKQHQTRCPNGKIFGHQTMFDGVWSPNISRLSRPLCPWRRRIVLTGKNNLACIRRSRSENFHRLSNASLLDWQKRSAILLFI